MSDLQKHYKSLTLAIIIVIGIIIAFQLHQSGKAKEMKTSENLNINLVDVDQTMKEFYKKYESVKVIKTEVNNDIQKEVKEEIKRPYIKDASVLSDKDLDYIWNKSNENDFSYELILAFARVESNFNKDLSSRTQDHGMFQIHSGTDRWIAKQLGLKNYNLMNVKTSTDFAIYYLTYLREQYRGQNMSEEDVFTYTIVSYNRGIRGANNYIAKHGENVSYLKQIKKYKEQYERSEVQS